MYEGIKHLLLYLIRQVKYAFFALSNKNKTILSTPIFLLGSTILGKVVLLDVFTGNNFGLKTKVTK